MKKKKYSGSAIIYSDQLIENIEPIIAKRIKDELKLKIIFIVLSKRDKSFYETNFPNIFDEIYTDKIIDLNKKKDISYEDIEKNAVQYEKKYNCSIYKLFFNHRVLGRGFFASGGVRHPRNRAHHEGNHKDFMHMALREFMFFEKLFNNNNIKLAINLPFYAHFLATKNGIKSLRSFWGRFNNTYTWTNVMGINPKITIEEFKISKPIALKKFFLKNPYQSHADLQEILIKSLKFKNVLKKSIYKVLQLIYGKAKGYEKSKNAYILDEFLYFWRYRKSYYEYLKYTKQHKKEIYNKKFIFFPLLTEPEESISGTAKDFFFQLSALNILARDLPADYRIVVKEHLLALGRRPKDFYRQINELKNVIMVDPMKKGLDIIKKSKAVACLTGSAGWEAAVMGIPVISFSKNNEFNILNHVYVINEFDSLRKIFEDIEGGFFPNKETMKDGAKFYSAYLNKFVNVKDYNYLTPLPRSMNRMTKSLKDAADILFSALKKKFLTNKKNL